MVHSPWSDEMVLFLSECAGDGVSTREISEKIFEKFGIEFTRNAIIGKARRDGIRFNNNSQKNTKNKKKNTKRKKERSQKKTTQVLEKENRSDLISFEELGKFSCRWPYGLSPEIKFCGRESQKNSCYCEEHLKVAKR